MAFTSTIAAIATGPAAGGIGIIRVSGPRALVAARRVARELPAVLTPRHAYFTRFTDAAGQVLDEGLALFFQAPHSFTGEEVVELHAHGAPRLLSLLLAEVLREEGVRPATAGEFTRRALLSGRIDLSRAEAVADLVAAESEAQVRAAAAQLAGELTARLEAVHAPLLALQADLEGALDFPEEAEGSDAEADVRLDGLLVAVRALVSDARRGALIRRGARVVLYGPVNAGKSTLFNALVGAARALVDADPGTTRDTLEARLELAGLAVTLIDTAGLREAAGRLEALGIGRTREALAGADLAVLVLPPAATDDEVAAWRGECDDARRLDVRGKADLGASGELSEGSGQVGERLRSAADSARSFGQPGEGVEGQRALAGQLPRARLFGQPGEGLKDLRAPAVQLPPVSSQSREGLPAPAVPLGSGPVSEGVDEQRAPAQLPGVSGQTGEGLEALRELITRRLGAGGAAAASSSSERHLAALEQVEAALQRAHAALTASTLEVVAGEVGLAVNALAEVTGEDASSALLDAIFARFCIGK